jgi:hypothetical protein
MRPLEPLEGGVDGCCRGFSATAKGSSGESDGHQMGQFTLLMKVVNPLCSDNLIGMATAWSIPGSGRGPERETPSSLEPRHSLSVVAGARNHLDLLLSTRREPSPL